MTKNRQSTIVLSPSQMFVFASSECLKCRLLKWLLAHPMKHEFLIVSAFQDSLRGSSAKLVTVQRRLAWPLRKDDKHTSRHVNNFDRFSLYRLIYIYILLNKAKWGYIYIYIYIYIYACSEGGAPNRGPPTNPMMGSWSFRLSRQPENKPHQRIQTITKQTHHIINHTP